jgi:DNA transformation protein
MKKDAGFVQYVVEDLFAYLSDVSARAMFGGYGIYRSGVMFGLVEDGELYFKIGVEQKEKYLEFGSRPFTYMKEGKPQELGYYFIPEEVQENNQLFRELAEDAYELALQKAVKKTSKKRLVKE